MLNVCTGVNIDVGLEVAEIPAKFFRFSGEMASGKHDPATKGTNRPECSKVVLEKDSISRTPKTFISNSPRLSSQCFAWKRDDFLLALVVS